MSRKEFFNVYDNIKEFKNEMNKDDLDAIVEEFKLGHFQNVLSKTKLFRENHETNQGLVNTLSLIDAICHSQIGEHRLATEIIMNMYNDSQDMSIDELILYGNLAFMCDYKLARRIMSDAVKQIENEDEFDQIKAAHAYLVLGETEENLQKYIRAIRYFKRSLTYFQEEQDNKKILLLHYKLGTLHSIINEIDEAIKYLQKTIELANSDHIEIKINSLVSIAKMYGNKGKYEQAFTYLQEAIPMVEDSPLANHHVYAEAYSEMADNYSVQFVFDKAVPYYKKAINMYLKLPDYSSQGLAMTYMQYAYCLEHQDQADNRLAGVNYEKAYELLEKTNDFALKENILLDIIDFFERTNNKKKQRFYEDKLVKLSNENVTIQ